MNQNEKYNTYSFLLERTARSVKQFAQRKFNELGFEVTVDQWQVLKVLYDHNDLNQREIAELTYKDHPTLTRIIDLLCKKELVERKMHPSDRRSFIIHLTEEGKAKVEFMKPQVAEIRTHAWHNLSDADFEEFKRILNTIYSNLSL
ncbi:MarR family transcriptional regulator [Cytophagales bacterium LB-30]|uniref:MarR family transcriptional regulator n=1 Tax=Shiella aurantiaca TaxID=3058365 RepID=A0ABT8F0Q3_9BACT|nr:MarR family transcriptional regulator [Shiella aurantiaca]MDN4164026.1 MarR family transcriptional regulator [Shiella aurantiaca]